MCEAMWSIKPKQCLQQLRFNYIICRALAKKPSGHIISWLGWKQHLMSIQFVRNLILCTSQKLSKPETKVLNLEFKRTFRLQEENMSQEHCSPCNSPKSFALEQVRPIGLPISRHHTEPLRAGWGWEWYWAVPNKIIDSADTKLQLQGRHFEISMNVCCGNSKCFRNCFRDLWTPIEPKSELHPQAVLRFNIACLNLPLLGDFERMTSPKQSPTSIHEFRVCHLQGLLVKDDKPEFMIVRVSTRLPGKLLCLLCSVAKENHGIYLGKTFASLWHWYPPPTHF